MSFPSATHRMLSVCLLSLLVLVILHCAFHAGSLRAPVQKIRDGAAPAYQKKRLSSPAPSLGNLVSELYKPIKLPVTATNYTDQQGRTYDNGGRAHWKKAMGRDIVIVDIDTRIPKGPDSVFSPGKMDWTAVHSWDSGLLTVAHINHFLYAQIHGYEYKYWHAQEIEGHGDGWIKVHVIRKLLQDYQFVIFMDAGALIQHLEVPLEFLFNRWDISPGTSIAMPVDTQEVLAEKGNISLDSKGQVVLNTGLIMAQNLPHTHDLLRAWVECPTEWRYPGCRHWKGTESHEQRVFSEYIRYDYNPNGNNIVEIPCTEANGFPGILNREGVVDDCRGEFIRHFTMDKWAAKASATDVLMQTVAELLQKNFAANHKQILIEEPPRAQSFKA